jgi:hypothetical protein
MGWHVMSVLVWWGVVEDSMVIEVGELAADTVSTVIEVSIRTH